MNGQPSPEPFTRCTATTVTGRRCRNLVPNGAYPWEANMLDPVDAEQHNQQRCHVHLVEHLAPVVDLATKQVIA